MAEKLIKKLKGKEFYAKVASYDSDGNPLSDRRVKSVSVDGRTMTVDTLDGEVDVPVVPVPGSTGQVLKSGEGGAYAWGQEYVPGDGKLFVKVGSADSVDTGFSADARSDATIEIPVATQAADGLMSSGDKAEFDRISGAAFDAKADKATTLAGYGITDAKIETSGNNKVVTLGSNTLTVGMSDGRVNTIDSHTLFAERATNDATGREIAPNLVPVASNQEGQVLMATASNTAEWSNDATSQFTVYEPIDTVNIGNREYRIVQIDGKWWMAENLDFQWDGLSVPTEDAQHVDTAQAMYYNYDESTYGWGGRRSGLLYNWYAVKYLEENKATLCPGWHVATHAEMEALSTYAGGFRASPAKLKAASWGGTDDYGFSAVPSGYFATGFVNGDAAAYFWTATEYSSSEAHEWELSSLFEWESDHKYGQCSVRLVKDSD